MVDRQSAGERPTFPTGIESGGVFLSLAPDQLYITLSRSTRMPDIPQFLERHGLEPVVPADLGKDDRRDAPPRALWLRSVTRDDLAGRIGSLREAVEVAAVSPVYQRADLQPMLTGHAVADDLLVRFTPDAPGSDARALIESLGATILDVLPDEHAGDLYHVALVDSGSDIFAAAAGFEEASIVQYAGPNWIQLQSPVSAVLPNDEHFHKQWNLYRIGAPNGWSITQGSSGVVIAVVDSGCDLTHPDLVNQLVPVADRFDAISNTTPTDLGGQGTLVGGGDEQHYRRRWCRAEMPGHADQALR